MDAFTGYVYTALWLILAVYMFVVAIKNSKFFFVLSGFFLFLSSWQLADELLEADLFSGVYSLVYRGVSLCVLVVCVIAYLRYKRSNEHNR